MSIHPTALIDATAMLGDDVSIGPFTLIGPNVSIGSQSRIGAHCVLGDVDSGSPRPLEIGHGALVRSHSIVYGGSRIGDGLETGHHVTIREEVVAGRNWRVGTLSDIQGKCEIGDFVRFHSNVFIGHLARVESFVWVFPYVVLTNDPHPPSEGFLTGVTLRKWSVVATNSTILPGVTVGEGALIGAHSLVRHDVPPETLVVGVPARTLGEVSRIMLTDGSGPAYPWRRHFRRGYPGDVVADWEAI